MQNTTQQTQTNGVVSGTVSPVVPATGADPAQESLNLPETDAEIILRLRERNKRLSQELQWAVNQANRLEEFLESREQRYRRISEKSHARHLELRRINKAIRLANLERDNLQLRLDNAHRRIAELEDIAERAVRNG